jgi:hypothetical protein
MTPGLSDMVETAYPIVVNKRSVKFWNLLCHFF